MTASVHDECFRRQQRFDLLEQEWSLLAIRNQARSGRVQDEECAFDLRGQRRDTCVARCALGPGERRARQDRMLRLPFLLLLLAAVGGNMIQHRLVWSTEQLTPKLSKISPIAARVRGPQAAPKIGSFLSSCRCVGRSVVQVEGSPSRMFDF